MWGETPNVPDNAPDVMLQAFYWDSYPGGSGSAYGNTGWSTLLNQVDEPERWSTYFMRIDDVKFRQKVVPGDTLLFRVELLHPVRHGVSTMKGYAFVGDRIVSEAQFTAQIVKNK